MPLTTCGMSSPPYRSAVWKRSRLCTPTFSHPLKKLSIFSLCLEASGEWFIWKMPVKLMGRYWADVYTG